MRRNIELYAALCAILVVSAVYVYLEQYRMPALALRPGAGLGHWLGVVGMTLMLATEFLYSLRKRARRVHFGRLHAWLSVHIFMGIFGPYLVLLHSAWQFRGLAGVATLLTVAVVASGFIGRYIYTAIPRTVDGTELAAAQVPAALAALNAQLQGWLVDKPAHLRELAQRAELAQPGALAVRDSAAAALAGNHGPARLWPGWAWRRQLAGLPADERRQAAEFLGLLERRRRLDRQIASAGAARRFLASWHAVHIPLGMVLFTVAILHALAGLYFGTLGK